MSPEYGRSFSGERWGASEEGVFEERNAGNVSEIGLSEAEAEAPSG